MLPLWVGGGGGEMGGGVRVCVWFARSYRNGPEP